MQLIDKGKAYLALKHEVETHMLPEYREAYERAARIIGQMKPVDAIALRHGHWIQTSEEDDNGAIECRCSICGALEEMCVDVFEEHGVYFCWRCGTIMDEE